MFQREAIPPPAVPRVAPTLLVAVLGLACGSDADRSTATSGDSSVVLFSESPAAWFDVYFTDLEVAPDGQRAVFDFDRQVDLGDGTETALESDLDAVFGVRFDPLGRTIVAGRRGDEEGWFRIGDETGTSTATLLGSLPLTRFVSWAPSGERVVYWVGTDPNVLFIGPPEGPGGATSHYLPARPSAAAWLPDEAAILVLVPDERGVSTLYALDPETGETRAIAERLDGRVGNPSIAISDDGRFAYLALASDGAPDPEVRHKPGADRDLDIYEIDLETGERRPVVRTSAEELSPAVANGVLHWIAIETQAEVVLVPAQGGEARIVADAVQNPTWRPDGRAIGVTTGNWRLADWALNLDGGVVELDPEGRTASAVEPIITGYHEDFSPVWSPDGRWIAYHSHRSPTPVSSYGSEGSSDDIYLRRPGAPTSKEMRLTDFGHEVGTPDWAPDGRRLLMDSWDEGGGASAWIVEIDPETGALENRARVPTPGDSGSVPMWESWSPAREEIALVLRTPGGMELWVLPPDGSDARRVATFPGPWYGGVDWSADGDSLVYGALQDDRIQLFSVPRSGGTPRQLTHDPYNLLHPQVSPDGRWIAASRLRHEKRILRQPD